MKKSLFLTLLCCVGAVATFAQDRITGIVTDRATGEALPYVTVVVTSSNRVTVTDESGRFTVTATDNDVIKFSFVGYKTHEQKVTNKNAEMRIALSQDATALKTVVVEAGIIQRNKMGFTGSYRTVTAEELRSVGSTNVLQSLRSLDPAFIIMDNNLRGSDPNTLANISLRGGSAMNISTTYDDVSKNPNEPLFILDGFETSLQVVNDLDINRIESITILKDAGSTAIYGSRGGNGVVVIETIKPQAGEVRISYSGDFGLSAADLSMYNLMNASEKLEFEVLAGRYDDINDWTNSKIATDYNPNKARVERGIDTYWLKVPIRTALTQAHSVNIDGGSAEGFLYQIGLNYKSTPGVMKGSLRESFGGNSRLQYRKDKLNVSNNISMTVTNGYDDSYSLESFANFARANPYYEAKNPDGTIPMYLDTYLYSTSYRPVEAYNPLYNASLESRRDNKIYNITNNTSLEWRILENLRWGAQASISTSLSETTSFKDPSHTDYLSTADYTLIGQYSSSKSNNWSYNLNTSVNYSKSLQEVHNFAVIGRAAVKASSGHNDSYVVRGFPAGAYGVPSFAYGYPEGNRRPGYSESVGREANFLLALNYNYDYRYLFDFNYNLDGTTAFGRNKKFNGYWSLGAGWNVNREAFAKDWEWLQNLKIRATFGRNGNQNVSFLNSNVYSYYSGADVFGSAAYLSGYTNPNLEWQMVTKLAAGIDLTILQNRLNLTFDVYRTHTDPLALAIPQKLSSGVDSYPVNAGYLTNRGVEFRASYKIIDDRERNMLLSAQLTGSTTRGIYGGIEESMTNLNKEWMSQTDATRRGQNLNQLVQYRDGYSPSTIWAVRSQGIDPATGREVFLTKDGITTFLYSSDDRVAVATRDPWIQGVFNLTFRWHNLSANCNFRYSLGGYEVNNALFTKVENVTNQDVIYNQDKRALTSRWKNPGDVAQFKNIRWESGTTANYTSISSRFIQRNNYFNGESARLSWTFTKEQWLKTLNMRDLQVSVSYSDLFRISTIKRETGIEYPFARTVQFGLRIQF